MTVTDQTDGCGFNTFRVIAYNENGDSASREDSDNPGTDDAPCFFDPG